MRRLASDDAAHARTIFARASRRLEKSRLPAATYRLQLHQGFDFAAAVAAVPYLAELGVTHVYASPYMVAASGSSHGYNVTDHARVNPELGGEEGLRAFVRALRERGMSHLLDFVPNHMGIGTENPYWQDVLENGPSSVHAPRFDIEWKPVKAELENKVLLPILGDQYGAVLEAGELRLTLEKGAFSVRYYEHALPINPRQYRTVLLHRIDDLVVRLGKEHEHLEELLSICTACENLPQRTETDPSRVEERRREKEIIKRRLAALVETSGEIRDHVEGNVRAFNGTPGDPRSFDLLDRLLDAHAYRLAHWRVAAEEINYRRFFDVNELAAIRMEDPAIFREAHALVLRLLEEGSLGGLRIDHPDGLFDPRAYFQRLQEEHFLCACRVALGELAAEGEVPGDLALPEVEGELRELYGRAARERGSPLFRPLFVVVEKILSRGEKIPPSWAIHGTTGYDFLNQVNGLFVDRAAEKAIDEVYGRFTGLRLSFEELVYEKKKLVLASSMSSEVEMSARELNRISEMNRRTRDFTLGSLRAALVEYVACFPVYRTYVDESGADERDRSFVDRALALARRRNPTVNASVFQFLRDVLVARRDPGVSDEHHAARLRFARRLQQLTGPVTAKGLEDTAFYVYNRLCSLNEVGGEPSVFGVAPAEFHHANQERLAHWGGSLLATSTHDTKRSEDVRTRIDALSELPEEWRRTLSAASKAARRHRTTLPDERTAPDRNEEYLLYQQLLGLWPAGGDATAVAALADRLAAFAVKAAKEAKINTSWLNADAVWEEALAGFARAVVHDAAVVEVLRPLAERVARIGMYSSLAQVVLKLASPGVADFYQGTELWDLSLVDPDNRRPVDFVRRASLLATLKDEAAHDPAALAVELWRAPEDGRAKLYVTWRGLAARRREPELFLEGDYEPLSASGPRAAHVVALARRRGFRQAIAVVPRLVARLLEERAPWAGTHLLLPRGSGRAAYRDELTGIVHRPEQLRGEPVLPLEPLWERLPVALLTPA